MLYIDNVSPFSAGFLFLFGFGLCIYFIYMVSLLMRTILIHVNRLFFANFVTQRNKEGKWQGRSGSRKREGSFLGRVNQINHCAVHATVEST